MKVLWGRNLFAIFAERNPFTMNYPLISEYIEAIKSSEDNFEELTNLRPILSDDGQLVMTSGNFAVVFKMEDVETGKLYAVKCFTREQDGREEAYHLIADALKDVDSPYLVSLRYLDQELFVDTEQTSETEFPVLLMDWVDGKTLDKYLRENLDDQYALEMLAYHFSQLAQWIIPQPFAHGDLKPDNILVSEDGTLVLVDYDGMYVPAMKGQKARELGSPDFRHPMRTEDDFDEHIDDFPLVSILLSLKAISLNPQLLDEYGASDRLLFSEEDYRDIANSSIMRCIQGHLGNKEIAKVYSLFVVVLSEKIITQDSFRLVFTDKCQEELYKVYEKQSRFDKYSKYYLSSLLRYGIGCERDVKKGLELIVELAEQGFAEAQFRLGRCYYLGEGLPKDYEKAVKWYTRAAEQGFGKAQNNLGYLYYNGQGGTQNYEKAAEWISKAAEQGLANSQYLMGVLFLKGHGVAQSYENAAEWFTKAANQGYASAQYSLGLLYCNAQGVPHSYEKANDLLIKAAEQGQKQAIKRLEQVTSDDIANAWTDEYGVMYSSDRKRLLKAVDSFKVAQYIISDKVQIICNGAFRNCKGLEDIFIPNSVRFIGEEVYYGCENLTSITIPSSIINIGDWVLHNCRNLKRIIVDVGNANYDSRDNCNAIIETKSNTLIAGCQNTRIPNGVTNIGNGAFSFVSNLNNITIPSSLIHIPDEAFWGCNGLTSVIIQNGVKRIGKNAFSYCSDLTSIFIPESVTAIEKGAFTGNSDECAPFPNNLMQINVDSKNPKYNSKDNCNAIIETESNTLIVGCQNTIIPNGITSISAWAFDGCFKLSSIVIPGSIVSIPDRTFEFLGLTSVTLLNGIMSIGEMAFYGCNKLTSIIIPNSITSIGNRAFAGCDKLTSIIIPHSVSYIGEEAFAGMDSTDDYQGFFDGRNNIERIKVDEGNVFYDSRDNCNAIIETQSNRLIAGCKNTIIPNEVKSIGKSAFAYCEELTAIEIPDGVTEIMDYAFYQCKSLKEIVLPDSITKIGKNAFESDCNMGMWGTTHRPIIYIPCGSKAKFEGLLPEYKGKLIELDLSTSVSEEDWSNAWRDEKGAMYNPLKNRLLKAPSDIHDYTIRKGTKVICADAFNSWHDINHPYLLSSIFIPDTVTTVGKRAFSGCSSLISVVFSNDMICIAHDAFTGCNFLRQILIPNGTRSKFEQLLPEYKEILQEVEENLSTEVTKEDLENAWTDEYGVKYSKDKKRLLKAPACFKQDSIIQGTIVICDYAFDGCRDLNTLIIPKSVIAIGNYVFQACNNLTFLYIGNPNANIGTEIFLDCKGPTILIPVGTRNIFETLSPEYKELLVNTEVTNEDLENAWTDECGVKYSSDKRRLLKAPKDLKKFSILNGTKIISDSAFEECKRLTSVVIPNSVTLIGDSAFSWCTDLNSIEIPNSVTSIGDSAFSWCTDLNSIEIPNSVISIGSSAFNQCRSLTSIIIPNSVTSIDYSAFMDCISLASIVIPNGVEFIRGSAFSGCTCLTSIEIPDSVTEIGSWAFHDCKSLLSISLPNSVTNIGFMAFNDSGITSIVIPNGSRSKFKKILSQSDYWYIEKLVEK